MDDNQIRIAIETKDTKSIELVMEMYSKLLWTVAGSILKNASPEEVEECVADVFFSLWQNPLAFDAERGSLKTYLAIIAKNKAIDRFRKLQKTYIVPFEDNMNLKSADILSGVVNREMDEELLNAIQTFSEPDREIMIRRIYYEQKPAEISKALSLQLRQVQNKIYRSKQLLKRLFLKGK
ncbi:hypothetical protein PMSD_07660 [Paenibacillus macquariensis subsp. defensor]|nr:hypothetical protein PMSD_07660 [Paenibacillus macquariensis subsp. defensor]